MALSEKAIAYIQKEIVSNITFRDHHQVVGVLATFDFMTYANFHKLLGYVENYTKIKVLKRFSEESRIEKNMQILMEHFTRESIKTLIEDKTNIRGNIAEAYYYAIEQIFKKMAAIIQKDYKLLSNDLLNMHPKLFGALLSIPDVELRQREVIRNVLGSNTYPRHSKPTQLENDIEAIYQFFDKHKIRLSQLCVIPNQRISVEQTQQLCITMHDYFKDDDQTSTILCLLKKSKFIKKGRETYYKPGFWGGIAASVVGLFSAAALAWFIAVITPGLAVAPHFMLSVITAVASVAVLILVPLFVKAVVSRILGYYNSKKLDQYEHKFYNEKEQYHRLAQRYGLIQANKPFEPSDLSGNIDDQPKNSHLPMHPILSYSSPNH